MPIQNGRTETRQGHQYGDVMRLHKAAPKLIVQERVGERMKISSYCPVASLTRAGLALGQLHHGLLAGKFRGVDTLGVEKMGLPLLPIPLQASAGKSMAK